MNSRERVIKTYNFELPDRIPLDFCADDLVYNNLISKLGLRNQLELMDYLNIDFRWARPKWIGPELEVNGDIRTDYLGIKRKGCGWGYAITHPLSNFKSIKDIENYNWPKPEYWDYEIYIEEARRFREEGYAVYGGQISWPFSAAMDMLGLEKFMTLLIDNPEAINKILEKLTDFFTKCSEIMFQKGRQYIDIFFNADDYGTQNGPFIGLDMWRKLIKPHVKKIFSLAKKYDLYILHHSCGSITYILNDLIEMGLNAIEPVQVRAYDMDFESLVNRFHGKVVLHGSIDTQKTLPFGNIKDIHKEVISRIKFFKDKGGFVIGTTQHLLPEVPLENILTMYISAYKFGKLY